MAPFFYTTFLSPFGRVGLVWSERETGLVVERVFLPHPGLSLQDRIQIHFSAEQRTCPAIDGLAVRLQSFLQGEPISFGLEAVNLSRCSGFQQRVLRAEHGIPRGWISTYGQIALHLGSPGAARAVGHALANNPFPLFIPCHRAIRSGGDLGGFQGGLEMKRALLEMEGIEFSPLGRVNTTDVYYR